MKSSHGGSYPQHSGGKGKEGVIFSLSATGNRYKCNCQDHKRWVCYGPQELRADSVQQTNHNKYT